MQPVPSPFSASTVHLTVELRDAIAHLRLNRPAKRNALNDALITELHTTLINLPESVRVVVLSGEGAHFSAGLDLSELGERSVAEGVLHSRAWHAAFDQLQFGRVPVIVVLHGAVVGGGLELAAAAHIRVAERSAFYGLPEGQRGLFVGGGGSARIPGRFGAPPTAEMVLPRPVLDTQEGGPDGPLHLLVPQGT